MTDLLGNDHTFLNCCNHKFGVIVIKELVMMFNKSWISQGMLSKKASPELNSIYEQYSDIKLSFHSMIVKHFMVLSQNCFGNYILQVLLD